MYLGCGAWIGHQTHPDVLRDAGIKTVEGSPASLRC